MTAIKMRKHVKTVKFKLNLMSYYLKILVTLMKMLKVGLWRVQLSIYMTFYPDAAANPDWTFL